MYTPSTHLKDVSIFLRNSIMKTEYWTIGIIVVALGLILYSQVNDSISSHRNFKVNYGRRRFDYSTCDKRSDISLYICIIQNRF